MFRYFLLGIFLISGITAGQNLDLPASEVVDPNLALFAASDYLPTLYPGNWEFYQMEGCYKLDGSLSAYIILFKNKDMRVESPDKLTDALVKSYEEIQNTVVQDPDTLNLMKRDRYHVKEFTTMVIGGNTHLPVFIRWYPGLPEYMVKKYPIQDWLYENYFDEHFSLGHLIYVGPKDMRYILVSIREKTYILSFLKSFEIHSVADVEQEILDRAKISVPKDLSEEQKKMIQESVRNKVEKNIRLWAEYQKMFEKSLKP